MTDQWAEKARELNDRNESVWWRTQRQLNNAAALRSAYEQGVEDGVWDALNTAETSGWDEALKLLHKVKP